MEDFNNKNKFYEKYSLLGLPDEIILHTFSYLPLVDLINLWDVCQGIRDLLHLVKRIRDQRLLSVGIQNFKEADSCYINERGFVTITGFRFILRFIRMYGLNIHSISVSFSEVSPKMQKIFFKQMIWRCKKPLEYLSISHLRSSLDAIVFPVFKKLKTLRLESCFLPKKLCQLSTIFPNMETLELNSGNYFIDISSIMVHYKNLKFMKISPDTMNRRQFSLMVLYNESVFFGYY